MIRTKRIGMEEIMKILDAAFAHPRGLLGRLGGTIMARGSAERNISTVAQLTIHPGDHILDVGCGPGALIQALAKCTTDGLVKGIDTSPLMLEQATRRNARLIQLGRVQLQRASALALPFADATFDIAVSANSVQLWPDQLTGAPKYAACSNRVGKLLSFFSPCGLRQMTRSKHWVIFSRSCSRAPVSVQYAVCSRT